MNIKRSFLSCKKTEFSWIVTAIIALITVSSLLIASNQPGDAVGSTLTAPSFSADVYQDMENGNPGDLLTPETMKTSSHGGLDGINADWEINGNLWVSTEYARSLPGVVMVNGTAHQIISTRTWRFSDKYKLNYVTVRFGSLPRTDSDLPYHERITIAGYYTPGSTGVADSESQHDTIILGGNETYAVLQTVDAAGGPYIQAHSCTQPGWKTTISPTRVKVETGKTYWVNLHHDGPAGEVKVAVFDPDNNWEQVGETAIAASVPRADAARSRVKFGRVDNHGSDSLPETSSYFSHIMIDYTHAVFPLLPAEALTLHGAPADQTIYLTWELNSSQFPTSWTLHYNAPQDDQPTTITGIPAPTSAYTLTGLTNNTPYTITLTAIGTSPVLSDIIQVTPRALDNSIYLPLVLR